MLPAIVLLFFVAARFVGVYVENLWFDSLGYGAVYWTGFRYQTILFIVFFAATLLILRSAFWLLQRLFGESLLGRSRTILLNDQTVEIKPGSVLKPAAWIISLFFSLGYGASFAANWEQFALFLNRGASNIANSGGDPIFGKPLGFYLFTLPVYDLLASWLTTLAVIILIAALVHAVLASPYDTFSTAGTNARRAAFKAVSIALALLLLAVAWRVFLARYPYLWSDHASFAGVTFTEANYLLPGLVVLTIAFVIAALVALVNAFTQQRLRLLLVALALPVVAYIIAGMIVPAYVTNFIVKPNELDRETPYIRHNIEQTRRAFALDRIEAREFEAEMSTAAFNLTENRSTLDNIRIWDWRALQETLRQMQAIRNYYSFEDVDVDRYQIGGRARQTMTAVRELDIRSLPEASRNWTNERLIYTHGYGVTMNTANGLTPDGRPVFLLSNMPIEAATPELGVTRPEIYFGERTNSTVYVRTGVREFSYPQGERNVETTYEGADGIPVGGFLRRLILAWNLDDLSKLPFSDDVTADSRVLMRRNIAERVRRLAPFLLYDSDPYIIVDRDGRLHWMIDAFTTTENYPYSRHYTAGGQRVNYIRNSVKATIDAYNGTVRFYVFDSQDPLIVAYRGVFPTLFTDASEMPEGLRAHVRYPELLLRTQAEAYGLYQTENPRTFFQREDVWSVAREANESDTNNRRRGEPAPLDPYYLLMQLPGEQTGEEFVGVVPFTPANRNNMIGWMAGRSDGGRYGSLLVYRFPQSRQIDGPLQIKARVDQNAQLSSQITLWNQQGSRVQRGNLLVIPLGRGLLYVEPIFLQAERSPMPELRLVVMATQERLAYGTNFEEALTNLFGETQTTTQPGIARTDGRERSGETGRATVVTPSSETTTTAGTPPSTQTLIDRAAEDMDAYQRLTAEGKHGEAGQRLESLRRTLEELRRARGRGEQ